MFVVEGISTQSIIKLQSRRDKQHLILAENQRIIKISDFTAYAKYHLDSNFFHKNRMNSQLIFYRMFGNQTTNDLIICSICNMNSFKNYVGERIKDKLVSNNNAIKYFEIINYIHSILSKGKLWVHSTGLHIVAGRAVCHSYFPGGIRPTQSSVS